MTDVVANGRPKVSVIIPALNEEQSIVETLAALARIEDEVEVIVADGGSDDRTTRVWDVASGKEIARLAHGSPVTSVVFSPNGNYVVSGSWDSTARVWEAATGEEISRMEHDEVVNSVDFSPDGSYVV